MSAKRTASRELNHDNWNDDDEPEEAGTFVRAPADVIAKRVIKTARRRNPVGEGDKNTTNVFSNFGGFAKTAVVTTVESPFAFLSNLTNTSKSNTNGLNSTISTSVPSSPTLFKTSEDKVTETDNSDYLSKLQNLNESVAAWITMHVDKNPFCILSPVFRDYEKHLAEIESLKEPEKTTSSEISTNFKMPTSTESRTSQASIHSASIFGKPLPSKDDQNPFLSKPIEKVEEKPKESTTLSSNLPASGFTFGNTKLPTAPASGFSFGSGTPYTFSNVTTPETDEKKPETTEDEEEPPKNDFTPVVEDNSIFTKRCKVFVKKENTFSDRGVGQLFLKPVENSDKVQLIVRQDTSLGNILLNLILSKSIPTQRMGKNNVMLVCLPDEKAKPPPVPILLRVKTSEEADELLSILEKHKK